VNDLTEERLRAHPELASLITLAAQLDLIPTMFAAIHGPKRHDAMSDQARSMSRVSRILADQVRAYMGLLDAEDCGDHPRRRP